MLMDKECQRKSNGQQMERKAHLTSAKDRSDPVGERYPVLPLKGALWIILGVAVVLVVLFGMKWTGII